MKSDFTFADLLTLNKFITPTIITVVYWILMVISILCGVVVLATNGLIGVLIIVLAPLYVRMICEMVILWYRIHGVLCEIRDQRKES